MSVADLKIKIESLTVAERKDIPLEDFAWPEERKFPVDSQDHLDSLATLIGTAPDAEQPKIKARAMSIAKRHGFTLPKSWQDEKQESVATVASSIVARPRNKIATLKVCWLQYEDRSENGRIYPRAICDQIYRSAVRKLANPDALPITTFISHETANNHVNTDLVGRVVKIWQEGSKFYANIDLADTSVAHDMLALAVGKYLQSESMRVRGVQLAHDRAYDLPIMVVQEGIPEPELMGIDLTTRPGLVDSARIQQVIYESVQEEITTEEFNLESCSVESQEKPPAMKIPIYLQVLLESTPLGDAKAAHKRIHDHLAGVLDATVGAKHGNESAAFITAVEPELTEEGRAIALKHAIPLAKAHDESAKQSGMACEGAYNQALNIPDDPDQDGIPDNLDPSDQSDQGDTESAQRKEKTLTEEEMLAALKAKGFQIEAPKTAEEKLAALEARLAEQDQKIQQLTESHSSEATQRQTLALSNQTEESTFKPEEMYEDGDYLKGELHPRNWRALADRRVPWPHDKLDPKQALKELAPFLAYRLNLEDAHARGRDISQFIESYEQV